MRKRVHVERFDDSHLVHVTGDPWKRLGAPEPRLAAPLELAPRSQQLLFLDTPAANLDINRLAVVLLQIGLVVKEIHLRRTAVHEEKDAALGLGDKVRLPGGQEIQLTLPGAFSVDVLPEKSILLKHGRHGDAGKPAPASHRNSRRVRPQNWLPGEEAPLAVTLSDLDSISARSAGRYSQSI